MSNDKTNKTDKLKDLLEQAVQCLEQGSGLNDLPGPSVLAGSDSTRSTGTGTTSASSRFNRSTHGFRSSDWQRQGFMERNSLFNYKRPSADKGKHAKGSKKKKLATWNHDFICLADKDQQRTPSAQDRSLLITAGLGSKNVSFLECGDAEDFDFELVSSFPKLKDCGGFELLRVVEKGRSLEVIPPPPDGYTASFIKAVVLQAKVYIRPIQRNLSTEPVAYNKPLKTEQCIDCGEKVPVSKLRSHKYSCTRSQQNEAIVLDDSSDSDLEDLPPSGLFPPDNDVMNTETAMMDHALSISTPDVPKNASTLEGIITGLRKKLLPELYELQIRRGYVLEDLFDITNLASFNPFRRVKTWFVGEFGKDTGGVTREMWSLFAKDVVSSLCEGNDNKFIFRNDCSRLKNGDFERLGILLGMSLLQGRCGCPAFAPCIFKYIVGSDMSSISPDIEEIPDPELRHFLSEISEAKSDAQLHSAVNAASNLLIDNGYSRSLSQISSKDVPELISSVTLNGTIVKIKAVLDQFMVGLQKAGVLASIQAYPQLFERLFVHTCKLNSEYILNMLSNRVFSEIGLSAYTREQSAFVYFRKVLNKIERGDIEISLSDVLQFFTGNSAPPPIAFQSEPTLNFSEFNPYPTASVCALSLTLPSSYTKYEEFEENVVYGIQNHGGFGLY